MPIIEVTNYDYLPARGSKVYKVIDVDTGEVVEETTDEWAARIFVRMHPCEFRIEMVVAA